MKLVRQSNASGNFSTELYALIQAYNLVRGKTANIYTDSGCIFGIAHDFGMFWKQRAFLTTSEQKI